LKKGGREDNRITKLADVARRWLPNSQGGSEGNWRGPNLIKKRGERGAEKVRG